MALENQYLQRQNFPLKDAFIIPPCGDDIGHLLCRYELDITHMGSMTAAHHTFWVLRQARVIVDP